ncbi:MAG TPA: dTDP-4-dehydrorhamnose reductase [Beijerinckia sp.]|jgi:dTDP-4-dehydrorhamnose reductase|nr:dTDP-4-dehydrorhamnose reductase [Beijerinckia sp.]
MRIAVTGSKGQVALSLLERGPLAGVEVVAIGRPQLDLHQPKTIEKALAAAASDLVVNAAAFTAVDKAETENAAAIRINAEGAGHVARVAAELGLPIIQLSTDYVFDGTLDRPYREDDPTGPISTYGRSKLAGEEAVARANPRHVILRTAWVYSPFGHNFMKTMLRLGEAQEEVSVVADQHGTPTSALDIADGVIAVAKALAVRGNELSLHGLFHMTGTGEASWADFAEEIFAQAASQGRKPVLVRRIASKDYPTPVQRPLNSRLSNEKLAQVFGIALADWRLSTRVCVERLLTG